MEAKEFIEKMYCDSMGILESGDKTESTLESAKTCCLDEILDKTKSEKGVLPGILTSLVYNILFAKLHIRNQQTSKEGR